MNIANPDFGLRSVSEKVVRKVAKENENVASTFVTEEKIPSQPSNETSTCFLSQPVVLLILPCHPSFHPDSLFNLKIKLCNIIYLCSIIKLCNIIYLCVKEWHSLVG